MASVADVLGLLEPSAVPAGEAERLIAGASELWLLSAPAAVLAGDLAQCHPALATGEVRVSVRSVDPAPCQRISVVSRDRPGLLAGTAAVLAAHRLSVRSASVTTWAEDDMALHGLTVMGSDRFADDRYREELAEDVRSAAEGSWKGEVSFAPEGPVRVVASPAPLEHSLVSVEAPDRVGLLWATASWFADHEVNVIAAQLSDEDGRARDLFLVSGSVDADGLARRLARRGRRSPLLGLFRRSGG